MAAALQIRWAKVGLLSAEVVTRERVMVEERVAQVGWKAEAASVGEATGSVVAYGSSTRVSILPLGSAS